MHFCQQLTLHPDPELKLNGVPVPVMNEVKFPGLIFDRRLTLASHIQYLKQRCMKALNLLRVMAHMDWGADSATLLKLYRSHVRSKLDYGSVVYGSALPWLLQTLDRVQNAALRTCLGTFRTLPISSLHAEAGEMPLKLRREKLALQYMLKLKSNPGNPAHNCVFSTDFTAHRLLNTCKGVICCRDFRDCSDAEVIEALNHEGVTNVKHFFTKKNGSAVPTNTFIVTFNKTVLPKFVKACKIHTHSSMGRLSRNPEHSVANTGGNPNNGRRACRAVQPVMVDERSQVIKGPGPVGFKGPFPNTPLWTGVHLRREVGCGPN
jgi:hypothetical protein